MNALMGRFYFGCLATELSQRQHDEVVRSRWFGGAEKGNGSLLASLSERRRH